MSACGKRFVCLFDGTFEGMFSAVAFAVKRARGQAEVCDVRHYRPTLFAQGVDVVADRGQVERLFVYLKNSGKSAVRYAMDGYLSEDPGAPTLIARMVSDLLEMGPDVLQDPSNESVAALARLSRRVRHEAHRLNGLLRFRLLTGELLYAPLESKYNIIGYCAGHFRGRMPGRRWILHDIGRDIALHWDGRQLQEVRIAAAFTETVALQGEVGEEWLCADERKYQDLWRSFHGAIANPGRENPRLQKQNMPKRYWKYLVEMV